MNTVPPNVKHEKAPPVGAEDRDREQPLGASLDSDSGSPQQGPEKNCSNSLSRNTSYLLLPRELQSLWNGREDLRLQFPNQNQSDIEAYIGWCLTEGIEQNGIDPEGLRGALGSYLNRADDFGDENVMPRTPLLRIMRPYYAGPCQESVCADADGNDPNELLAIWLCTTARRYYEWPLQILESLREWLCLPSALFKNNEPGLSNAMATIYRTRPDVRSAFDLSLEGGNSGFGGWIINNGVFEYDFDSTLIPDAFLKYLRAPDPRRHGLRLTNFHYLTWHARTEIWDNLPLGTADDEAAFIKWVAEHQEQDRVFRFWLPLLSA